MTHQHQLEQLIAEYQAEDAFIPDHDLASGKEFIQRITITMPGFNGALIVSDAARYALGKYRDHFVACIYCSFNGETKPGRKYRERIEAHPALKALERRRSGRSNAYFIAMDEAPAAVAQMVLLIVETLVPGTKPANVRMQMIKSGCIRLGY